MGRGYETCAEVRLFWGFRVGYMHEKHVKNLFRVFSGPKAPEMLRNPWERVWRTPQTRKRLPEAFQKLTSHSGTPTPGLHTKPMSDLVGDAATTVVHLSGPLTGPVCRPGRLPFWLRARLTFELAVLHTCCAYCHMLWGCCCWFFGVVSGWWCLVVVSHTHMAPDTLTMTPSQSQAR
jgi:hypothetical protein